MCRSTHLRTTDVPTASELFDVAMGILRKLPELMPCNRLAISTNLFQPLAGSDGGAFHQKFPLTPKKSIFKGNAKEKAAGAGSAKVDSALPLKAWPVKQKQMVVQDTTKNIPQAAATPHAIIEAHPSKDHADIAPCADVAKPAAVIPATADFPVSPRQGQQRNTAMLPGTNPQSTGAAKSVGTGRWVQRRAPIVSNIVQPAGAGSSLHDGTSSADIRSTDNMQQAPFVPAVVGTPGVQQAADSAATRWMQWAQQAATEKQSVDEAAEQSLLGTHMSDAPASCGTGALHLEQNAQHTGHTEAEAAHGSKNEIINLTDEPECDLGSVDIAEQRHILNLIQMKTPRAGRSSMPPDHRSPTGVIKGGVRKQSSILSLLSKK